jgi:hypothetical protein
LNVKDKKKDHASIRSPIIPKDLRPAHLPTRKNKKISLRNHPENAYFRAPMRASVPKSAPPALYMEARYAHAQWTSPRMAGAAGRQHNGCRKEPLMARKYAKEFKLSAVGLVNQQGYTISQAAKSLGVDPANVRFWVKKYG